MAYEEFQVRLSHLNLKNLCLEIGYEKDSATRNSEALKAEVKDFLKEYEIREHMIPPCGRADPVEARLCATNFLVEEGRGERLFPPNPEGAVVWSTHRALYALCFEFNEMTSLTIYTQDNRSSYSYLQTKSFQ